MAVFFSKTEILHNGCNIPTMDLQACSTVKVKLKVTGIECNENRVGQM